MLLPIIRVRVSLIERIAPDQKLNHIRDWLRTLDSPLSEQAKRGFKPERENRLGHILALERESMGMEMRDAISRYAFMEPGNLVRCLRLELPLANGALVLKSRTSHNEKTWTIPLA